MKRSPRRIRARRLVAALLTAVLAALVAAVPAQADSLDNKRKTTQSRIDANQAEQSQLQDALEELQGTLATTGQQLVTLQGQLPAAQSALDSAQAEVSRTQREVDLIAARLADATKQAATLAATIEQDTSKATALHAAIAQMGREAYRSGPDMSGLDVMMGATSSQDFVDGYADVSTALRVQTRSLAELESIDATNKASADRLTAVRDRITELKVQAEAQAAKARTAARAAADAKAALAALTARVAAQQAQLESQKADIEAQLAAADAAANQLAAELAQIVAEQRRQRAAAGQSGSLQVSGAVFGNPTVHSPMVVTSEYGMRWQPILHIYRLHAGLDLRDRCGEPVYAGRAGTVRWSMFRSGYGNQVMIDHGWVNGTSLMSSYSHLTRSVVSPGQQVSAGQVVGYAGSTGGISTGCHLHFEVYINGSTVNPRPYLGL
jgi:murein DD-endopeptidase MepM/ murein hydrolase activator NlpD